MSSCISQIEYYLPESVLDNEALENLFPDWTAEKIERKTGIRQRHIAADQETALDLAFAAAERVFKNYDREKIDFLMLCTQSPDYFLPTSACVLQDKLGLRTNIGAFDFNLGCSGFVYGLSMAKGVISAGVASSVLLVTAETYSKHISRKDRSNRTIFGDGAAATIIEKAERNGILEFSLGTDGSGFKNLIVANGGMRHRGEAGAQDTDDGGGGVRAENGLYMNGPEIFNFTLRTVPKVVSEVLQRNGLAMEDVDFVIFHQANKFMLEHLRDKLSIPDHKFYINLALTGNTVSATIPISLKDCMETGKLKRGNRVLLVGFGVGYSWGGTIVEI